MSDQQQPVDGLTAAELEQQQAAALPSREAMSLIDTAMAGGPVPLVGGDPAEPSETTQPDPATTPTTTTNPLEGSALAAKLPMKNPLVG